MTRAARRESSTGFYHVTARGNGRQLLFDSDRSHEVFLKMLAGRMSEHDVVIHTWCLMDNHVHLLLQAELEAMSAAMHRLLTGYARYFNCTTGHVGHVLQDRFGSVPIETESHFLGAARYILLNPVRAELSPTPDFRWSSYGEVVGTASGDDGGAVDGIPAISETGLLLDMLGGVEAFEEFIGFSPAPDSLPVCALDAGARGYHPPVGPRAMSEEMIEIACAVLDCTASGLHELKTVKPRERKDMLRALSAAGLSIRDIERLTGIGRGAIAHALKKL